MYKIKLFDFVSTVNFKEEKASIIFERLVNKYGIENVKLVYLGKGVRK